MTKSPASARLAALDCFLVSLRLGLTSFGGPIAHLGYFERAFVQQRRWLSPESYAGIVGLCQALPGPASSQVNFLVGVQRAGLSGGVLSFLGFTLPSALVMLLAALYLDQLAAQPFLLHGLKLAAAVVVAQAVWHMALRLCTDHIRRILAAVVLMITLFFGGMLTQIGVLCLGALAGWFLLRRASLPAFETVTGLSPRLALRCLIVAALLLIALPVLAAMKLGGAHVLLADTFYRAGALVFGGGHVVLPLLHATAGIANESFMALYGVAQALPGPLFAIAAGLGAAMLPAAPVTGAVLALFFIFLPGILFALAGFYYWQHIAQNHKAAGALAGVNAAVVGLLASAFVYPVMTSAYTSWPDLVWVAAGFALLQKYHLPPIVVVALSVVFALVLEGF